MGNNGEQCNKDGYVLEDLMKEVRVVVGLCIRRWPGMASCRKDAIQSGYVAMLEAIRDYEGVHNCSLKHFVSLCVKHRLYTLWNHSGELRFRRSLGISATDKLFGVVPEPPTPEPHLARWIMQAGLTPYEMQYIWGGRRQRKVVNKIRRSLGMDDLQGRVATEYSQSYRARFKRKARRS